MKKLLSVLLALVIFVGCAAPSFAAAYGDEDEAESLCAEFFDGMGPEVNGFALDYAAFSPVKDDADAQKYPLVVWLHGMGGGACKRSQLEGNGFYYWAREDFQSRFPQGGAYLLAPRSPEDKNLFWTNELIEPLMAAIADFAAQNENVDTTRIYLGGYSMGGKMTIRTAITYPNVFAAIFPICPASDFGGEALSYIKDIPMWLTVSTRDILAGWYTYSRGIWDSYCGQTSLKDDSRLSLLGKVCYPDGKKTSSNHHAWYAVTYDMFAENGGDYYNMTTYGADGREIKLEYPDGMISWLSAHTSDYAGGIPEVSGGWPLTERQSDWFIHSIRPMAKALLSVISEVIFGSIGCRN